MDPNTAVEKTVVAPSAISVLVLSVTLPIKIKK
jgi:hypothetical protein